MNSQATYFHASEGPVGTLPYLLPSLYKGMQITFIRDGEEKMFFVEEWSFLHSDRPSQNSGLHVTVSHFTLDRARHALDAVTKAISSDEVSA